MKYFCAECQKKHDIADISADLFEVCSKEINSNLLSVAKFGKTEEYTRRFLRIQKFANNAASYRKVFMFNKEQLMEHIQNPVWEGNTVSGTFVLDFQWLLNAYEKSGASQKDEEDARKKEEQLLELRQFPDGAKRSAIFSKNMSFVFFPAFGRPKDLIFGYISPGHGDDETTFRDISHKRGCPHCGKNLSQALGRAPEIVVALAGNPRAGKTSCITAIASALRENRYMQYGLSIEEQKFDEQWKKLKDDIARFDQGYIVEKTPPDPNYVPSYSYLVRLGENTQRVMTFVDMPGEFWSTGDQGLALEFYQNYAGLYENIDCIWFFISKLAVHRFDLGKDDDSGLEETLATSLGSGDDYYREIQKKLRQKTADSSDTINGSSPGMINAILSQLNNHLSGKQMPMPPVAVILTKSEVMHHEGSEEEFRDMEDFMLFPASHGDLRRNVPSVNLEEFTQVLNYDADAGHHYLHEPAFHWRSTLVRHYMCKHNDSLRIVIERNCPRRCYISMAAYGHAAAIPADFRDGSRKDEGIQAVPPTSFHEMYPLLWTLAITNSLHVRHGCGWFTPDFGGALLGNGSGSWAYGTMDMLFDSTKPLLAPDMRPQARKKQNNENDHKMLMRDISANLLLTGENPEKRVYTQTEFLHPRR